MLSHDSGDDEAHEVEGRSAHLKPALTGILWSTVSAIHFFILSVYCRWVGA